ncbi:MAG: hypothetical protein K6G67_03990 [Lachnospiraceae bacterium]|nr:hypothetical protein [Lachnospiraceae bacterium]
MTGQQINCRKWTVDNRVLSGFAGKREDVLLYDMNSVINTDMTKGEYHDPEGKAGEDIPFIARIICVADSYDAMNTNRVYRDKLSKEHILEEIERCKGKQFEPKIADVMITLIKNDELE